MLAPAVCLLFSLGFLSADVLSADVTHLDDFLHTDFGYTMRSISVTANFRLSFDYLGNPPGSEVFLAETNVNAEPRFFFAIYSDKISVFDLSGSGGSHYPAQVGSGDQHHFELQWQTTTQNVFTLFMDGQEIFQETYSPAFTPRIIYYGDLDAYRPPGAG